MTENSDDKQLVLPALRGIMGDWAFYTCLMKLNEVAKRIHYAEELHQNRKLSEMIQRRLEENRGKQIAEYLRSQDERFFNSIVVATYGGNPNWIALSSINGGRRAGSLGELDENTISSIGFLTLDGSERLFALDGQHRLSGIKRVVGNDDDPICEEEISIILVSHNPGMKGLERTRRLFTTLNKTARPVSKRDIIALDEDDVMAICVRQLIERTRLFIGSRISYVASNNLPSSNSEALTTIGNLYDILGIFFTGANHRLKKRKSDLRTIRPDDEELEEYFEYASEIFRHLKRKFPELREFFNSSKSNVKEIVRKYRSSQGGSAVFRPIGLDVFARVIAKLMEHNSLPDAMALASKLPRDLRHEPYVHLMRDPSTGTVTNAHKVTLREILLYMLNSSKMKETELLSRYRKETGQDKIKLPKKLI